MPRQHLKCQKYFLDEPENPYWRIVICEADLIAIAPKSWRVCDITHHDSEALADKWLHDQWGISIPPERGVAAEFVWDSSIQDDR
jgi:hypothetical protein